MYDDQTSEGKELNPAALRANPSTSSGASQLRPPAVTRPSRRSRPLSFVLRGGSSITIGYQQNSATDPRQSAQRQGVVIDIASSTNHEPNSRR